MLTVLQVAYPLAPVSLDATGGAEQVMSMIDRGLKARGHRSIAIACEGSRVRGELLPFPVPGTFDENGRRQSREAAHARIREAVIRCHPDVIHMHGVDFYEYLPPACVPTIATLHLPRSYYPDSIFKGRTPDLHLNCVSHEQRREFPADGVLADVIENGIPLDLFPKAPAVKARYALSLGRICPEKGFHLALDAAERAGVPFWLAGMVFPYRAHEEYFRRELAGRLSPPNRFLGPLDLARKVDVLARARCLLAPSLAPETSSLVAREAMASGTPVIAFRAGALAGVVEDGRTGFLVNTLEQMAEAIGRIAEIDPKECRRRAQRFSDDRMVEQYLGLYRRVVAARPLACV